MQTITGPVSGATTDFAYDDHGRIETTTGSDGYAVSTDYDAFDRPTQVTYPDSTYEQITYDKLDVAGARDLGRWTHYVHDAVQHLVSTQDPAGRTITQQWCRCGSMDKLIDANNNATTWDRDLQGRVTRETRANSTHTDYVYESTTSRLKQRTDPKGQHTNYTYFKDNNIDTIGYTNETPSTPDVNFTGSTGFLVGHGARSRPPQ